MKVMELKSRKIIEVNDSYGARLIEQGKATLAPITPKPAEKPRKKDDA